MRIIPPPSVQHFGMLLNRWWRATPFTALHQHPPSATDWWSPWANSYPVAMTSAFRLRTATALCAAVAVMGTSACGDQASEQDDELPQAEDQEAEDSTNPILEPDYDDDETVALPIGLVSPAGYDWEIYDPEDESSPEQPHGRQVARTETFGCQDYISVVQTVPIVTEDPGEAALEYLTSLDRTQHGSPEFLNPLASSGLGVTEVDHDGDTVTINLTGTVASNSVCQSWQILKQIETTARAATGAQSAEILLEGSPLAAQLGLEDPGELSIDALD